MKKFSRIFVMFVMITVLMCSASVQAFAAASAPSISTDVVYDANGITISTAKLKYDKSWGGYYTLDAVITNKSDMDINYELQYIKINGFQIPTFCFGDVYSGMSADMEISCEADRLTLANIEHIMEIEVCIRLSESDNYGSIIDMPVFTIYTSDADKYEQSYEFNGKEVYNANGIRILARLGNSNESFPVLLYVDNSSGKTVSMMYDDIAINNKMVMEMMSCAEVVSPALQVIEMDRTMLTMWDDDVPTNKDISVVDFKLSFLPKDDDGSFSTANLYYSDRITVGR